MVMFWTARSPSPPPPSYHSLPAPPSPSRYELVPNRTLHTARSASAMPRSTGASNIRSAYRRCSLSGRSAIDAPPVAGPGSELGLRRLTLGSLSRPCPSSRAGHAPLERHDPAAALVRPGPGFRDRRARAGDRDRRGAVGLGADLARGLLRGRAAPRRSGARDPNRPHRGPLHADGHLGVAPHRARVQADGPVVVDRPLGEAGERLLERDPTFEAGERGAEAEVDPVPERHVVVDRAVHVEAGGVGELALVAPRRAREQQHARALVERLAVELDGLRHPTPLNG